ncbi:hypothetical protein [Mesobacterium pallidum]|uniref:hypothetical protein n=1 Tax=Mesobacterium pallidum TaxID=2872037 RepID=UPI001EE1C855|nr:hypothetical protein [Mesobacterium pallidum]
MKKADAEKVIRSLVHDWAAETGFMNNGDQEPSFYDFWSWLEARAPQAKDFRSVGGADYIAEMWFDEELGQLWRR